MEGALERLPDEIIQLILRHVPAQDVLSAVALTSRRLHTVSQEPLLWKYFCVHNFKYWQAEHYIQRKLVAQVHDVDWKRLFIQRLQRNIHIAYLIDGIVASRVRRLQKSEAICLYGYDAKDYLLSQCKVADSADDVLARRFYSCTVLDSIHRSLAIEEWAKYQDHAASTILHDVPDSARWTAGMQLERALGAFDMFMLHDDEGDMDEISALIDSIAQQIRNDLPGISKLATRARAVALVGWLYRNNMTGLDDSERTYRYLRNCLIGRALRDDRHPSLPIISAAIYACIASRFDVEAYVCSLPSEVHVVVLAPPGVNLDGITMPGNTTTPRDKMYLNPFKSDDEVPLDHILEFLARFGSNAAQESLLGPTATDLVVMRVAQSIRASFTSFRTIELPLPQLIPYIELNRGDWARNLQPALYSMIWASIMMVPVLPENEDVRWDWQQDVRDLLTYFYEYFPEDSWLIEKYVCPMYDTFAAPTRRQQHWELPSKRVRDQIREIKEVDASIKTPRRRRDLDPSYRVRFRVGQVFKHRRYDYHGLIIGWSVEGSYRPQQAWQGSGPSETTFQPFYRCMVGTDGSDHHVIAEDNIEAVDLRGCGPERLPCEIRDLMPMAGKFFKRWDSEAGVFVSNLREVFPED
ncbi:F-box domain-containing protein [Microdochium trichocladiopsis]|uniref:F-box domain-containing protein n=1 Tax=Microdochium trichocladiopsis TaxID=1682393 RepID=A0A9P8XWI5_9PEZI|nr:F-box domain-containing protein [Microdochium trichocladiopsis]KAH7018289.1 F-box domain-containing protein [Microdochium trichocladiopsis]